MEHFMELVFWITLLGCLQTKSLPISDFDIDYLRTRVKCESHSTFYAPTNVKANCITTALDCVMKELIGTAKWECEDLKEDIPMAADFLDNLIQERTGKGKALTNSTECACERWTETPFSEFLTKTFALLQLENSEMS